jgi:hypothetical protein
LVWQVSSGHWAALQHSRQTPLPLMTQQWELPLHPSALLPSQQRVRGTQVPPQHF